MEIFVYITAILLIVWPIPAVFQHVRLVGAAIRLASVPAIAKRLASPDFNLLFSRSLNSYNVYAKIFPTIAVGLLSSIVLLCSHCFDGSTMSLLVSLALAGYVVQMYGFQSFPVWMRNWDVTLRMTRDVINLETIAKVMKEIQAEMLALAGKPDSPEASEQLDALSILLLDLIEEGAAISADLKLMEQQVQKLPK